jgi:uncharacterized membrane protein
MKTFEKRLPEEIKKWVTEKIIEPTQGERILAMYPPEAGVPSRLIAIISMIGGTLLMAGIVLFIGANWQHIGNWTKIIGLLALLAGAHYAGFRLKMSPGHYPKTGEVFFMMGCILFLAGIALVSQIFHLNARPATGVLVWWLGIAAIPFITNSRGAQFVSIVAFLVWLGMEFATDGSILALNRDSDRYFHEGVLIQYLALFLGLGMALFVSGIALRSGRFLEFAGTHEKWGLLVLHATLYLLGFYRHLDRYSHDSIHLLLLSPGPLLLVVVLLGASAWWAVKVNRAALIHLGPWLALALAAPAMALMGWDLNDGGWTVSAIACVALFVLDLALIRQGVAGGQEAWINLAIAFIAVNIITRYFDLFGSMMEGSLLFITSGALILGGGIYAERQRRRLLLSIRKETV